MTTDARAIRELCKEIAGEFRPLKIVLFGSRAYGRPKRDSDVDLLVIKNFRGSPHRHSIAIRRHVNRNGVRFPMDIIVRTPRFVAHRVSQNDWFMREIVEKGRVMYESAHARMDKKG